MMKTTLIASTYMYYTYIHMHVHIYDGTCVYDGEEESYLKHMHVCTYYTYTCTDT
jgi:hypothetical protein